MDEDDFFMKPGPDRLPRVDVVQNVRDEDKKRSRVEELWQDDPARGLDVQKLENAAPDPSSLRLSRIRYPAWFIKAGKRFQMGTVIAIELAFLAAIVLIGLYFAVYYTFARFDIFSEYSWLRLQAFYARGGAIPWIFIAMFVLAGLVFGYGAFRVIQNNIEHENQYAELVFKPILYPFQLVLRLIATGLSLLRRSLWAILHPARRAAEAVNGVRRRPRRVKKPADAPADGGPAGGDLPSGGGNDHEHTSFQSEAAKRAVVKRRADQERGDHEY